MFLKTQWIENQGIGTKNAEIQKKFYMKKLQDSIEEGGFIQTKHGALGRQKP